MDHFANCKPGDVVTVTLRGEFERDPFLRQKNIHTVGRHAVEAEHPSIISVTVEPRPLAVGDRVRHQFNKVEVGKLAARGRSIGIVDWSDRDEGWAFLSDLERVDD